MGNLLSRNGREQLGEISQHPIHWQIQLIERL